MVYARKLLILNLSLLLLCLSTLILLPLYGVSQRTYADVPVLKVLAEPSENVAVWRQNGVSGRILFHFDRNMHAIYDPEHLIPDNDNYIYMGILENFVRTVYHIIPDRSWPEVSEHLTGNPDAVVHGSGFRISFEGTPLFILRARDIPPLEEKVLVHINGDTWLEEDWAGMLDLLARRVLRSDVVTVSGTVSANQMRMLRDRIDDTGP